MRHANNAALNYDLKIRTHLLLGQEVEPALPGYVQTLQVNVKDNNESDLLSHYAEACTFIGNSAELSPMVSVMLFIMLPQRHA